MRLRSITAFPFPAWFPLNETTMSVQISCSFFSKFGSMQLRLPNGFPAFLWNFKLTNIIHMAHK